MTQPKGRSFYQGKDKKYFYTTGDSRSRQAARLKAATSQTGGAARRPAGVFQPHLLKAPQLNGQKG